jgi:acyl carrier protein
MEFSGRSWWTWKQGSLLPRFRKGDDGLATVYERVRSIVADKLGVDEGDVEESSSFVEDLNADSLDLVELIMAFEEEFSTDDERVEISDEDAGEIHTIKDAVAYLKNRGIEDGQA